MGSGCAGGAYEGVIAVSTYLDGFHEKPGALGDDPAGVGLDIVSDFHVGALALFMGGGQEPVHGALKTPVVYFQLDF
jgi:hypothetical protein